MKNIVKQPAIAAVVACVLIICASAGADRADALHERMTHPMLATNVSAVLGKSVQGRPIVYHTFGTGPIKRLLVGGIHGGYEFNTVRLISRTIEHLSANPGEVPSQVTLYVIPNMNPDGSAAGSDRIHGRTNANKVDLNRNWDFKWRANAFHGFYRISGGSEPFSEPETRLVRDFIESQRMDAVIFYHSAANAVFPAAVVTTTQTISLAKVMARATGYRYLPEGIAGQMTTGDAIDYLAAVSRITAVEVELISRADIEWNRNLAGIRAFLKWNLPLAKTAVMPSAMSKGVPLFGCQSVHG